MRAHHPFRTVLIVTSMLGPLLGACGAPPTEAGGQQSTEQPIAEVTVSPEPCTSCAERDQQIAAAQAQAMAQAMRDAEAMARAQRLRTEAAIRACIADRERRVNACNAGIQAVAARAAGQRALCMLTNPCRIGSSGNRMNTCIAQGGIQCNDFLNGCLSGIPVGQANLMLDPNAISRAFAACYGAYSVDTCKNGTVSRACNGTGNFDGLGSTIALCEDYLTFNCTAIEQRALATASQDVTRCLTEARIAESLCLGGPDLTRM